MDFIFDKIRVTCEELSKRMIETVTVLDGFGWQESGYKKGSELPVDGYRPFVPGTRLGGKDRHWWFSAHFKAPSVGEGQQAQFRLRTGDGRGWDATNPQAMIYLNGVPVQGVDVNHTEVLLEPEKEYDLVIYLYSSMRDEQFDFSASLERLDTRVEKLYYDLFVPFEALAVVEAGSEPYVDILKQLELAADRIDFRQPKNEAFYESVAAAEQQLDTGFYHGVCGEGNGTEVACIGHTHIDVAWLWTLAQTKEKAQRTFATMLRLMKQYPEFIFMSSQPQLYLYVKQEAPALYEEIKKAVAEGRWEVEGAMWLEADCNLISGESFVRQILFGKRFMKKEFGVDSTLLWLPDVFGYSAALPQILQKSGVDKFVTSKIGWNEFNKLPYDSFEWEGIDGSRVFTHFITARAYKPGEKNDTACTYNGYLAPAQIAGSRRRYQQKEYNKSSLMTYGFGDGGGGPHKDMLEQQRRLSYGIPGIPKTKVMKVGAYLDKLHAEFDDSAAALGRTPTWVGELYLEFHRGTYTSIARNKRNNRKSELLYQRAEALSVADLVLDGGKYPQEKLNENWQCILLNQFHDIIPGSSIFEVYEDSDRDYARILGDGEAIETAKRLAIASRIGTRGGLLVFNPNSFPASGPVETDGGCVYAEDVPAHGWKVIGGGSAGFVRIGERSLENGRYRLTFDENYNIASLTDKLADDRAVLAPGQVGNRIEVFEDFPKNYDDWEITNYYKQKKWLMDDVSDVQIFDEGERAGFAITRKYLSSTFVQRVCLYKNSDRIDFVTEVDWHEHHQLVKAAFPLNVHTARATYDIQFGNVERPTHENTSWDQARFEVCGHKWADLSEGDYGVSLLNDCKYGHSTEGNILKLTLIKCGTSPNPEADQGKHVFTYSLYPHFGDYRNGTVQEAYLLNNPMTAVKLDAQDGPLPEEYSLVCCDCDDVVIETAKKAEDSDDIIVRFYEAYDQKTEATLEFGFDFREVWLCDLLENEQTRLTAEGRCVTLPVSNFEIVTLKVKR